VSSQQDPKSVAFEVAAWDSDREIGDGTHRRHIVNVPEFEKRFGVFACMRTSKAVETASHSQSLAAEPSNVPTERVDRALRTDRTPIS
jgi:hypothetical protein